MQVGEVSLWESKKGSEKEVYIIYIVDSTFSDYSLAIPSLTIEEHFSHLQHLGHSWGWWLGLPQ